MNKPKSAAKLPQGRIGCVRFNEVIGSMHLTCMNAVVAHETDVVHYAIVLPMPTLAAAKKRLRWEKLSTEAKDDALQRTLANAGDWSYGCSPTIQELSAAILSLIQP